MYDAVDLNRPDIWVSLLNSVGIYCDVRYPAKSAACLGRMVDLFRARLAAHPDNPDNCDELDVVAVLELLEFTARVLRAEAGRTQRVARLMAQPSPSQMYK
jgi:hypothetical protein